MQNPRTSHQIQVLTSVFLLVASGCATFSKQDCQQMNWADKGFESATAGATSVEKLTYYQKECGIENGIQPDAALFNQGYQTGLKTFCSANNGLEYGRQGLRYNGTCPADLEKPFLEKYQLGRIEYAGDRIQALESEVSNLKSENSRKDAEISDLQSQLNQLQMSH